MPRTGRPPKDNPKDTKLQIRLDKEYLQKLDDCAAHEKTTRSEIVRRGIDLVYAQAGSRR